MRSRPRTNSRTRMSCRADGAERARPGRPARAPPAAAEARAPPAPAASSRFRVTLMPILPVYEEVWRHSAARGTEFVARRPRPVRATRQMRLLGGLGDARDDRRAPVDDRRRLHDVALQPELLWLQPQGEPDELRQMQDGHLQLAPDDALGQRLLQIEVEVAQRAGRDQAVGVGVDRVA